MKDDNVVILLKQNNSAIRSEIKRHGINVCVCAEFSDADWLYFYPSVGDVHGVGFPYEGMTKQKTLEWIKNEWELYDTKIIECNDVHDFIEHIKKYINGNKTE